MPNRILKESICTSESLTGLSPRAELFFYRLIVNCDDYGRMDARTAILRSKCFPLMMEAVAIDDIEGWLHELAGADLIRRYQWADRPYLELVTWGKHQKIRAKRSKYPGPDGAETLPEPESDAGEHLPTDADGLSRNPNPNSNPNPKVHPNPNPNPKQHSPKRSAGMATGRPGLMGVTLSTEERRKLTERYGRGPAQRMIETLAAYKERSGRIYRSDYRAILNWVAKKVLNEEAASTGKGESSHDAVIKRPTGPFGFDRERFLWNDRNAHNSSLP